MSTSEGALLAPPPHPGRLRALALPLRRVYPEPVALALLAGTLGFWDLTRNGWANTYYSAAVRSMSLSWHNFLFASLDPSGVMSVDKPPLALWVQTLSVKVFGFRPLAILAPQVLMGIASVLLLYDLTRRRFGRRAGFLAGLVLTLTPITVAISRHNNPDALLVLCCVAALWCALRATESERLRWYLLAGVCLGLGFETKMLVALVVLPGMLAAWVWARPAREAGEEEREGDEHPHLRARRARVGVGRAPARVGALRGPLTALLALLLVGGAWPALVELTPAPQRPWVSGTGDNRVLSLIFGYNGLGRVEGQGGGPQALGGSNLFGGTPGPLRLLDSALGGQAGWMLGFALLGALPILLACRLRRRDARSGWMLCVGGAFLTTAALFSFARGILHPYYVSLLAPLSAALVGAGFGQLTARDAPADPPARKVSDEPAKRNAAAEPTAHETPSDPHTGLRSGLHIWPSPVLAALAVAAGVATELAVLHDYPGELAWLTPTLIVCGALAVGLLLVGGARLRLATLSTTLALLILAPATWAVETLGHATSGTFPAGGPAGNPAGTPGAPGAGGARPGGPGGPAGLAGGAPTGAGPAGLAAGARAGVGPGVPGGAPAGPPPGVAQGGAGGGTSAPGEPPTAGGGGGGGGAFSAEGPAARARAGGLNQLPRARGGLENGTSLPGAPGQTGQSLQAALRYAKAHGGGTVAVSSQSEAAPLVIAGSPVAGIGGFSGRESETTAAWLAQEVRSGRLRWVLVAGGPGGAPRTTPGTAQSFPFGAAPGAASGAAQGGASASAPRGPAASDTRRGASAALSAASAACRAVSSVEGLYDCAGRAAALAAAARD